MVVRRYACWRCELGIRLSPTGACRSVSVFSATGSPSHIASAVWSLYELSVSRWTRTSSPSRFSQPRHEVLEFRSLEDHVELRDRVRPAGLVAEPAGLDLELTDNRLAQFGRFRLCRGVVINMGVIAFDLGHLTFLCFGVYASSFAAIFLLISARHSSIGLNPSRSRQ